MLPNDPPKGTRVYFVKEVRKAKAYETATLIRSLEKYPIEKATDLFEVEFKGETMIVQRQDISKSV